MEHQKIYFAKRWFCTYKEMFVYQDSKKKKKK